MNFKALEEILSLQLHVFISYLVAGVHTVIVNDKVDYSSYLIVLFYYF